MVTVEKVMRGEDVYKHSINDERVEQAPHRRLFSGLLQEMRLVVSKPGCL